MGFWDYVEHGYETGVEGVLLDYTLEVLDYNWGDPVSEAWYKGKEYFFDDEAVPFDEFLYSPAVILARESSMDQVIALRDMWSAFSKRAQATFDDLWSKNVPEMDMIPFDFLSGHSRAWVELFNKIIEFKDMPEDYSGLNNPARVLGGQINKAIGELYAGITEILGGE